MLTAALCRRPLALLSYARFPTTDRRDPVGADPSSEGCTYLTRGLSDDRSVMGGDDLGPPRSAAVRRVVPCTCIIGRSSARSGPHTGRPPLCALIRWRPFRAVSLRAAVWAAGAKLMATEQPQQPSRLVPGGDALAATLVAVHPWRYAVVFADDLRVLAHAAGPGVDLAELGYVVRPSQAVRDGPSAVRPADAASGDGADPGTPLRRRTGGWSRRSAARMRPSAMALSLAITTLTCTGAAPGAARCCWRR